MLFPYIKKEMILIHQQVVELYKDGLSLKRIARKLDISRQEAQNELLKYRNQERMIHGSKKYSSKFESLLCSRYSLINNIEKISDELNLKSSYLNLLLKRNSLILEKGSPNIRIDWKRFDICPNCKSDNINDLNSYINDYETNVRRSFCKSCWIEWFEENDNVYKIDWAYID
jgi:orotate phosphoribosyltransferase-like protein